MNNTIKSLLALALMLAVTVTAQAGVKKIGTINGLDVYRIKTAGVFAPSTTTVVVVDPKKPGTVEGTLNHAGGPGFVPAVANAGGIVGGAALLRPARSNTNVEQSGGGANASNTTLNQNVNNNSNSNLNSPSTTVNSTTGGSHNHHNN